jgi:hypothetical protein
MLMWTIDEPAWITGGNERGEYGHQDKDCQNYQSNNRLGLCYQALKELQLGGDWFLQRVWLRSLIF